MMTRSMRKQTRGLRAFVLALCWRSVVRSCCRRGPCRACKDVEQPLGRAGSRRRRVQRCRRPFSPSRHAEDSAACDTYEPIKGYCRCRRRLPRNCLSVDVRPRGDRCARINLRCDACRRLSERTRHVVLGGRVGFGTRGRRLFNGRNVRGRIYAAGHFATAVPADASCASGARRSRRVTQTRRKRRLVRVVERSERERRASGGTHLGAARELRRR